VSKIFEENSYQNTVMKRRIICEGFEIAKKYTSTLETSAALTAHQESLKMNHNHEKKALAEFSHSNQDL
jgi:hypothetical protein